MKRIHDIISYENESSTVDFKKTEYPLGNDSAKHEILKDFSAFANNLSDEDKYIVIGVKEKEDKSKAVSIHTDSSGTGVYYEAG